MATCEDKQWASLINMMALASVIGRPVYPLYPEVNFKFRPLMMNLLKPRRYHADDTFDKPVYLLWSRDGNLVNRPNAWYKPNHIVAVMCVPDAQHKDDVEMSAKKKHWRQAEHSFYISETTFRQAVSFHLSSNTDWHDRKICPL